jgi:putative transposase
LRSPRTWGISGQTIYNWRKQDHIDRGVSPGVTSSDLTELVAEQVVPPRGRFEAIATMAEVGHPAEVSCRVLGVSDSGFYAWRSRSPSARSIRHAWLTDMITQVHVESRGTYGARRVHAELTMDRGITVGHNAVAMLMQRASLQGLPGARRRRSRHQTPAAASDLVERRFTRTEPDQLWVSDITEHPTREGKVYCAVVLDTFPRRIVGWSIDALAHGLPRHQRARHGDREPKALTWWADPFRPRHAVHLMGVHPPGPGLGPGALDGLDR